MMYSLNFSLSLFFVLVLTPFSEAVKASDLPLVKEISVHYADESYSFPLPKEHVQYIYTTRTEYYPNKRNSLEKIIVYADINVELVDAVTLTNRQFEQYQLICNEEPERIDIKALNLAIDAAIDASLIHCPRITGKKLQESVFILNIISDITYVSLQWSISKQAYLPTGIDLSAWKKRLESILPAMIHSKQLTIENFDFRN